MPELEHGQPRLDASGCNGQSGIKFYPRLCGEEKNGSIPMRTRSMLGESGISHRDPKSTVLRARYIDMFESKK